MLISFNIFDNLINKFTQNPLLAISVLAVICILIFLTRSVIQEHNLNFKKIVFIFMFTGLLSVIFRIYGLPVYFAPDLLLALVITYGIIHLNQQVSPGIVLALVLIICYVFLSEPRMDFEFDNNYLVALKPFVYLIILYLVSKLNLNFDFLKNSIILLILYPFLLLLNIAQSWASTGQFLTRPYFLFENNFEIPFLLYVFIALTFIYQIKDIKLFLLLTIAVLLTGSRSGLLGFFVVMLFYAIAQYGKKGIVLILAVGTSLIIYFIYVRGLQSFNPSINSIDRLHNFYLLLSIYDYKLVEIMSYPFGFGIYQKIPPGVCEKAAMYAEWTTGNMYNCDPIMLQSFLARGLFQYGIYILLLVPLLFFLEIKRVTGSYLAIILMIPISCAALSVGGFSNGLSFGGLLFCIFAYNKWIRVENKA